MSLWVKPLKKKKLQSLTTFSFCVTSCAQLLRNLPNSSDRAITSRFPGSPITANGLCHTVWHSIPRVGLLKGRDRDCVCSPECLILIFLFPERPCLLVTRRASTLLVQQARIQFHREVMVCSRCHAVGGLEWLWHRFVDYGYEEKNAI